MWFLTGLLLGMAIIFLAIWLHLRGVGVRWYEGLLAVLGFLLVFFALQNYWATGAEHWSAGTPLTFLLTFGLPGLALLVTAAGLVLWRYLHQGRLRHENR